MRIWQYLVYSHEQFSYIDNMIYIYSQVTIIYIYINNTVPYEMHKLMNEKK